MPTDGSRPCAPGCVDSTEGWRAASMAAVALFIAFGILYSFGAFFTSMEADFGTGKGGTALMFAVTTFALYVTGPWSGRLADRRGPRLPLIVAAVFFAVGLVATSLSSSIWHAYLFYGVGVGVGVGFVYVPMVAAVSRWFVEQRTTALGVAVSGNALGTMAIPPIAALAITQLGWRATYAMLGIVAAAIMALCAIVMPRNTPDTEKPADEPVTLSDPVAFRLLYITMLCMTLSLFTPLVFIHPYAETRGIGATAAAGLISLVGVGSLVGRVVLGMFSRRFGAARLLEFAFATLTASYLIWLGAGASYPLLGIFALLLGTGIGGFAALMPAVVAEIFSVTNLGSVLGLLYTASGLGGLIGPPLTGLVIDNASEHAGIIVAMTFGLAGTITLHRLRQRGSALRQA